EEREGNVSLMKPPVNRIKLHVMEKIVHPAHIPFKAEPESAKVSRARNAGPRGLFLGDGHDPGEALVANFVEAFQEIDGIQIFAATKSIRDPLPFLARIVERETRSARTHAQPVDVKLGEPVERVCDEKIADFIASEVKNER